MVTYALEGNPRGFTASSVISVAAEPPSVAFAVSRDSMSGRGISQVSELVINFLDDTASEVATRFAMRGADRFTPESFETTADGLPFLPGASGRIRGDIVARHEVGDSFLVVVRVREIEVSEGQLAPLIYLDRRYRRLAPLSAER